MNDPFRNDRRTAFAQPGPRWGTPRTETRVTRAGEVDVHQSRLGTVVFGSAPVPQRWAPRSGFQTGVHRLLRSAVSEERRPGLLVFAATLEGRLAGRLWLAATEDARAGTVGRHELVDLPLSPDAALSLRHFLFVVRSVDGLVRFTAIDLETHAGLHTSHGRQRSVEAERPVLLRAAGLCFWCVPTGPQAKVPDDAANAWVTFNDVPLPAGPSLFERIVGRAPRVCGSLRLTLGTRSQTLEVDDEMLAQGLLLGRDERCAVVVPDAFASRVHLALLDIDDTPHVIDTGSSNGTWATSGERVRCRRLVDGEGFYIGHARLDWRALH